MGVIFAGRYIPGPIVHEGPAVPAQERRGVIVGQKQPGPLVVLKSLTHVDEHGVEHVVTDEKELAASITWYGYEPEETAYPTIEAVVFGWEEENGDEKR